MNLTALFDSLSTPKHGNLLAAIPIPDYPQFRIAVDHEENPVLLLSGLNNKTVKLKNHRLKYLQVEQNKECRVTEGDKSTFQAFTLITFLSNDKELQEYYFQITETLIKSLKDDPTPSRIVEALNRFIEIFRALTDTPTKTIQGLWTELFLIENSNDPEILLSFWHNSPEEKFDFDAGEEKIEVKSTSGLERIHEFSSEQLNPPLGTQALIASLFTRQTNSGKSIQDLMQNVASRIEDDTRLAEKMNIVVSKTLGNSLEQSIKIKFDYEVSKSSLRFYKHQDISKVEKVYIPTEVSGVRYKSDLSSIKPVDLSTLEMKGMLFSVVN